MGGEEGSREKSQRLGPQKQVVETQHQNRVTETQRKPDLTMLTRNRGGDEVGWRDRQTEYQREQRRRQVEGESESFSSYWLLLRSLGDLADAMRYGPR